jgi:hypothetical protein
MTKITLIGEAKVKIADINYSEAKKRWLTLRY